jgi:hypothetical protein
MPAGCRPAAGACRGAAGAASVVEPDVRGALLLAAGSMAMFVLLASCVVVLLASPTASEQQLPRALVVDRVDWPSFLTRHDLTWSWNWSPAGKYTIMPRSTNLSRCGGSTSVSGSDASCCVQPRNASSHELVLALCQPDSTAQQWQVLPSGQYVAGDGRCLQDGRLNGGAMLGACVATSSPASQLQAVAASQLWTSIDGYLYVPSSRNCLQVVTPGHSFCTGTVCPLDRATVFTTGMTLGTSPANNGDPDACVVASLWCVLALILRCVHTLHAGDRSQLFAAFTSPSPPAPVPTPAVAVGRAPRARAQSAQFPSGSPRRDPPAGGSTMPRPGDAHILSPHENLIPLTWTTSAYVGNGLIGVRVAAEAGSTGVLRLLIDRVDLGQGGHRLPSGYFRCVTHAQGLPLKVSMRQSLYEATLVGNISSAVPGSAFSFRVFVDASTLSNNLTAVAIQMDYPDTQLAPELEWVPCASGGNGNKVNCGFATAAAQTRVTNKTVDGVSLAVQNASGVKWAAGWRWLTSDEEAFSQPFTQPVVVTGRERTARKQRTALFSIGACGTPACADGSLAGEYCPCGGDDGIDPSAAAAHAINTRARAGMPLMLAVSRSCACIESPCLKHCVHGASIGTSGVVGQVLASLLCLGA